LGAARADQELILRDAETLDELTRDSDNAHDAVRRVALLEKAIELAEAQRKLTLVVARLRDFPDGMELWRGTEPADLENLRDRLTKAQRTQDTTHRKGVELDREIERVGLAEPVAGEVLDGLTDRVDEVRGADEALESAREAAHLAETRLAAAGAVFGARADLDRLAELDEAIDAEVGAFAHAAETHARRAEELRAQLSALEGAAKVTPPAPRAIAALEDWLTAPAPTVADARQRRFLIALAIALALAAAGLAFVHLAFLGLLALAVVAAIGARGPAASTGPTAAEHAQRLHRLAHPRLPRGRRKPSARD